MTVAQLRKALEGVPDDTELLLYLSGSEDAEWLNKVEPPVKVKDADTKYCKGDSPVSARYSKWARDHAESLVLWLSS